MLPQKWPASLPSAKYITDDEILARFVSNRLPTSQIELTLSCRNLLKADVVTKSDPYCVVFVKESGQNQYYEVARTETISDTQNPQWIEKIQLNYNFETIQRIRFIIREENMQGYEPWKFFAVFETTLGNLVSHTGRQYIGNLNGMLHGNSIRNCGQISIGTEELLSCKQIVRMQLNAEYLPKLSWVYNNDAFLIISRNNGDDSYSVVAKTEPVKGTQSPSWQPFSIRVTTLCNSDFDRTIKIDCYDHRSNGNHKLIGTCYSTLRTLLSQTEPIVLVNEAKRKAVPSRGAAGILIVDKIDIIEDITFLDYIRNGTQLHLAVAIDFTASNGIHTDPSSLHYLSPNRLNQYEITLRSIGGIIEHYDNSQLFPAFGFGAKLAHGKVSHMFNLNGNQSHPYCSSIDEILQHYRRQLNTVQLCGPTNFASVINNTASIAAQFQDGSHYFILLIITDGIISDVQDTKHAIINASSLPISIIIVGVGDAEFDDMDELDSDDVRLTADGRYARPDIVQFVQLDKFLPNNGSNQYIQSQVNLAKDVLADVPVQLIRFMKSRKIRPQVQATTEDILPDPMA